MIQNFSFAIENWNPEAKEWKAKTKVISHSLLSPIPEKDSQHTDLGQETLQITTHESPAMSMYSQTASEGHTLQIA